MFQAKLVEKINKNILFSVTFIFFENRAVYGVMWENILERVRPQMATWCMRIACWIPKAANTLSEYVTLVAFPLQQWLQERASM